MALVVSFAEVVIFILLVLVALRMLASANQDGARWNHVLIRCEELRNDWLEASPKDIWEAKRFQNAETTQKDLFQSYEALMEATSRAVHLAHQTKIFLPKPEREHLEKILVTLNEAAVDANASANFTRLEANGVERVNTLRVALNAVRSRVIQDLEALLYGDTDRRLMGRNLRRNKPKGTIEPKE